MISTASNPTSFSDFNNSAPAVPFFQTTGEGIACFDIDLLKSGISGLVDGANITIEVVFDGGDGELYQVRAPSLLLACPVNNFIALIHQCADLTLSSSYTIPANATSTCAKNVTSSESNLTSTSTTAASSATSTSASGSSSAAFRETTLVPGILAGLMLLAGAALTL